MLKARWVIRNPIGMLKKVLNYPTLTSTCSTCSSLCAIMNSCDTFQAAAVSAALTMEAQVGSAWLAACHPAAYVVATHPELTSGLSNSKQRKCDVNNGQ